MVIFGGAALSPPREHMWREGKMPHDPDRFTCAVPGCKQYA